MTGSDLILVILLASASYFSLAIAYSSGFKLLFLDIFSNEFDSFSTNPHKKNYTTCNNTASKLGVYWLSLYIYKYKHSLK